MNPFTTGISRRVLLALESYPQGANVTEIYAHLKLKPYDMAMSSIYNILKDHIRNGLVSRTKESGEVYQYLLTQGGQRRVKYLKDLWEQGRIKKDFSGRIDEKR